MGRFENIGVIKNEPNFDETKLNNFENAINQIKADGDWNKKLIVDEFKKIIPKFIYSDNGKYLDGKM